MKTTDLFQTISPLEELPETAARVGLKKLLVKRDDLLTMDFGGCKVRNISRQIQSALENNADTLLMAARVGSNSVAAASLFASRFGLRVSAILKPQVSSTTCRFNIELSVAAGTEIIPVPFETLLYSKSPTVLRERARLMNEGKKPHFIGFGGGDIEAALAQTHAIKEVWSQACDKNYGKIESIYVAGASFSTAAGMAAGLSLLGLKTKLVIIGVAHESAPGNDFFEKAMLAAKLTALEWNIDGSNLSIDVPQFYCAFNRSFGEVTEPLEAEALSEVRELNLDPVYTRKAFNYMLRDAVLHPGKTCLFWHTGNSRQWPDWLVRAPLDTSIENLLL